MHIYRLPFIVWKQYFKICIRIQRKVRMISSQLLKLRDMIYRSLKVCVFYDSSN